MLSNIKFRSQIAGMEILKFQYQFPGLYKSLAMRYKFQIYMYSTNRMEEFERFQYLRNRCWLASLYGFTQNNIKKY